MVNFNGTHDAQSTQPNFTPTPQPPTTPQTSTPQPQFTQPQGRQKKILGKQIGNGIKIIAVLSGGAIGLSLIVRGVGSVTSLFSDQPRVLSVSTAQVSTPEKEEDEPAPSTDPTPAPPISESDAAQLWNQVSVAKSALEQAERAVDLQMQQARSERWQLYAGNKCLTNNCPSPYSAMLNDFLALAAEIQQESADGKLPTDSESIQAFRHKLDTALDLAEALSQSSSRVSMTPPKPFIQTSEITQALDRFYQAAAQFDSQRVMQSLNSYERATQQQQPTRLPATVPATPVSQPSGSGQ